MRIHVVSPVVGEDIGHSLDYFSRVASPGTEVTIVGLEEGPSAIESDYDISLAAPGIVRRAKEAETSGADAVIINCMADPALYASREAVRIPVVAPAQTAFALAASLTDRFSVLGTTSRDVPFTRDLWRRYGHVERGASVRVLGLTVQGLRDNADEVLDRMVAASVVAIEEDGVGAIIFGCTLMAEYRGELAHALVARGHDGVVVIDPLAMALQVAEVLVRLGLTHSGVTWPPLA
jgi:allantoin racemase